MDDRLFQDIIDQLKVLRNLDLSLYRRATITRRLKVRLLQLGLTDHRIYLQRLQTDPLEADRLINIIGVSVSAFFRDPLVFSLLDKEIIPRILEKKKQDKRFHLRLWSAGCAYGEEPYTVAMLLDQLLHKEKEPWEALHFASDISERALAESAKGLYPLDRVTNVPLGLFQQYFHYHENTCTLSESLRRKVIFCQHDLTSQERPIPTESIYGTFDLILCRNVLIYFDLELQTRVLQSLWNALADEGFLVLGSTENLPKALKSQWLPAFPQWRIWQKPKQPLTSSPETFHA